MKLQFMSLFVAAGLFLASCGTTYQSTTDNAAYNVEVPLTIRSSFAALYPDANNVSWNHYDVSAVPIDWELTGWPAMDANDYVVTFNMGNDQYHAWYDSDGTWIGSTYGFTDQSRLPLNVQQMIQSKYPGYTIVDIDKEMWKDQSAYEIKLKKDDDSKIKLLVDINGNVLKEKMDD